MPEKSVREMSAWEKKHHSLAARTFHATLIGAVILGIVMLFVGLGLYTLALSNQYIGEAFNLSKSSSAIMTKVLDIERLSNTVMERYHEMNEQERSLVFTDEYNKRFVDITGHSDYQMSVAVLNEFRTSSDVNDIYLAMYDKETSALVYIADPDQSEETGCPVGSWEDVSPQELDKFLNWDGKETLYHIENTDRYGWLCTSGVPIQNKSGETVAFVLADITLGDIVKGIKTFLFQYFSALVIVTFLLAYFLTRHMKKHLVEPINKIADAALSYVQDRRAGNDESKHFAELDVHTGDEIENLSLIMSYMEKDLTEFESNLTKVTAEKERIGTELSLATRIQADMLPNIYPAFPDRPEFDIYASMDPAKEVGGDFYDFFLIDDDHLAMVMADVSGKGVPAALFMMVSKILVKNYSMTGITPAEVLQKVNDQICKNNREEMFVTIWLGILEISTGKLTASNAGHEYPILKDPNGVFDLIHDKHGFVIGGMDGSKYSNYELQVYPGSKLFLYTDGVTEATDSSNQLFGTERLLQALNDVHEQGAYSILHSVIKTIDSFVGEADQFDDITMLCFQYLGMNSQESRERGMYKEITIPARVDSIEKATDFINDELEALDCPLKIQTQIDVAIDELLSNISNYAYDQNGGKVTVRFQTEDDAGTAVLTFIDEGIEYDPLKHQDPDTHLNVEERGIGGLGIFLVKKTMDSMEYRRESDQNILIIKKRIK